MRNLSLRHIETLQAIAAAGSLVQAAAALNVTPAALTARVKALEDAVALKLFDRTASGMRLTKAGEAALEASRGVERAVRDFADAMLALSTGEGGRLSVGAVSTAKYFAPRLIAAFVASRPKVDLRFLIGNRDATIESLRSGEVEIVLSGRPPRDMAVETFPLGPHPYVLIAPPGHRLAGAKGLNSGRSRRRGFSVPGDGFGHAVAVRWLHRRNQDQTRANGDGARLERDDQAGSHGGAGDRAPFGSYDRGRGSDRKAGVPRRRRIADCPPVVRPQPNRPRPVSGSAPSAISPCGAEPSFCPRSKGSRPRGRLTNRTAAEAILENTAVEPRRLAFL